MINDELVTLIQDKCDEIIEDTTNYPQFEGYVCHINNELDYNFVTANEKIIEANMLFGSAVRNNDLEDKYNMNFIINIRSEANGGMVAKELFDVVFVELTRQIRTLGAYTGKIFFTSPVITSVFNEVEEEFQTYLTMNGNVEFSKGVVLGCTYKLSIDGTNYIPVFPRQPYCLKEAVGGMDKNIGNPTQMVFTKSSNQITINLILILELDGTTPETSHDTLYKKLLDECYGASSQAYTFQTICGGITKTFTNLTCVRGQHIYDEASGENVLSLQFKVGA